MALIQDPSDPIVTWEQHQARHGYSDQDVEKVSTALYDAGLEEVLGVPDEALDDVARIVLALGMRLPERQ